MPNYQEKYKKTTKKNGGAQDVQHCKRNVDGGGYIRKQEIQTDATQHPFIAHEQSKHLQAPEETTNQTIRIETDVK